MPMKGRKDQYTGTVLLSDGFHEFRGSTLEQAEQRCDGITGSPNTYTPDKEQDGVWFVHNAKVTNPLGDATDPIGFISLTSVPDTIAREEVIRALAG